MKLTLNLHRFTRIFSVVILSESEEALFSNLIKLPGPILPRAPLSLSCVSRDHFYLGRNPVFSSQILPFSLVSFPLLRRMLELNKKLHSANVAFEKPMIQRQIQATDKQIDKIMHRLIQTYQDKIGAQIR